MPFSAGTYTKARDFTTDASNAVNPSAANFDEVIDDISTALSATLLRNGTVAMTGDLDLSSHNLNGTGNIAINTNKFNVTGSTGAVHVAGDLDVATTKFTVASATGNTVVAGTLKHANHYAAFTGTNFLLSSGGVTSGVLYVLSNVTGSALISSATVGITTTSTSGAAGDLYFTVAAAGLYQITAGFSYFPYNAGSGASTLDMSIIVNSTTSNRIVSGGGLIATTRVDTPNSKYISPVITGIFTFAANDKIRICYKELTSTQTGAYIGNPNIAITMISPS